MYVNCPSLVFAIKTIDVSSSTPVSWLDCLSKYNKYWKCAPL